MISFACKGIKYFGISRCTKSVLHGKKQVKMDRNVKQEKLIIYCNTDIYFLLISHFYMDMYRLWVRLKWEPN
jgi:hypothetical protein